MRAAVLAGLMMSAVSAAHANPFAFPLDKPQPSHLSLSAPSSWAERYADRQRADLPLLNNGESHIHYAAPDDTLAIGPIRADGTEEEGALGRRSHVAPRYRLEGVSVLGGAVGGTVDGRGAMLSLHWGG